MRQGQGTFVAELSRAGRRRAHCDKLADEFRSLVRQALSLGLTKRELQEILRTSLAELDAAEEQAADSRQQAVGNT